MDINVDNMLRVGTVLHGTYRIDRYLSSGGFGNTYVATNIQFGEQYAIKEFFMRGISQRDNNNTTVSVSNTDNRDTFASQLEKFKKEARRLHKLNNEHIVRVHDLFEENGTAYYVMDYIDGENLSDRLKRTGKPLSEAKVMQLLPQILDALETAHKEGILHLDLNPANIMVDKQGVVKLIDFGASKQQSAQGGATTSTAVSYTNGYAPREQMEQNLEKFGPWTDFYALGATLYTLLTNKKPPLPSDIDDDGSEDKHLALPMPANCSEKQRNLVLWLMDTNKNRRPQNIEEIKKYLSNSKSSIPSKIEETILPVDDSTKLAASDKQNRKKTAPTNKSTRKSRPYYIRRKKQRTVVIASIIIAAILLIIFASRIAHSDNRTAATYSTEYLSNDTFTVDGVSFVMIGVQGGVFTMGATREQGRDACWKEKPVHRVAISSFRIGQTEVTEKLWKVVMGSLPGTPKGDEFPVDSLSYSDCISFINHLNAKTGEHFRLPTEAEWEYAARGGRNSKGYKYSGSNKVEDVAWIRTDIHKVGTKQSNELGLYDMSGNVAEWCHDYFGKYDSSDVINPSGPSKGKYHVVRGGYSLMPLIGYEATVEVRNSYRDYCLPDQALFGLRLAL